ncbi:MAG: helix-turn-helix domain-containing protein [Saprospiraceae bacterium]|nr:helix-turn-helix domain-containing protein [Saprospiraceae bacterium]
MLVKTHISSSGSAQNPMITPSEFPVRRFIHIIRMIEDALRELLKNEFEVLRSELKEMLNSKNEEQRYLTRKEVARYLGVALSTVDLWSRTGKLRKINVNGSIRFDKYEVDRIFDSKSDKI